MCLRLGCVCMVIMGFCRYINKFVSTLLFFGQIWYRRDDQLCTVCTVGSIGIVIQLPIWTDLRLSTMTQNSKHHQLQLTFGHSDRIT